MDAELQAIPWMDQPALAPVGSVFCEHSPEAAGGANLKQVGNLG